MMAKRKTLVVFALVLLVYTILYFIQPIDSYMLDFTSNKEIAQQVLENKFGLDFLMSNDGLFGTFLYKLFIAWNVSGFQYSLVFIKIGNYLTALILIGLIYWAIYLSKKDFRVISLLLLAILALNFMGIFEQYSSWNVKILLCICLLSYCLFQIGLKKNDWYRIFFFAAAYFVQIFAFFLPFFVVFLAYGLLKILKNNFGKLLLKVSYIFSGVSLLFILFNFQTYSSGLSLSLSFKVLESYLLPMTRFVKGDNSQQVLYALGGLSIAIVLCILITDIFAAKKKKDFWFSSLLIVSVLFEVFFANKTHFASSEAFALNSALLGMNLIRLYEKIPVIKVKKNEEKKPRHPHFGFANFAIRTGAIAMIISCLFTGSFSIVYQDTLDNLTDTLSYAADYDGGIINDSLGAFGDNADGDFIYDYKYFADNQLLEKKDFPLEYEQYVTYIRGVEEDNLETLWLQSNFAIELYVYNGLLYFSLYSPIENEVTLYANNECLGTITLHEGANNLFFDMMRFFHQAIILRGDFATEFKSPLDRKGKWACSIVEMYFTNLAGFYDPNPEDGSSWTEPTFKIYYPRIYTSKVYTFYQPESFGDNGVSIYANDELLMHQTIDKEFNEVFLDLDDYIGESLVVTFKVDNPVQESGGERILGLNYVSASDWLTEMSFDIEVERYFMTLEPLSKGLSKISQTGTVTINGNDVRKFNLNKEDMSPSFDMGDYLGETIHIDIDLSYGCGGGGFEASFEDYTGLVKVEKDGSSWTKKEFSFYYPLVEESKVFTFYQPESFGTNGVTVYVNGIKRFHQTIKKEFNELFLNLDSQVGESALITFEVDSVRKGDNGESVLGLYLSEVSTWLKKIVFDLDVTGYFMALDPLSKGLTKISQNGTLSITRLKKNTHEDEPTPEEEEEEEESSESTSEETEEEAKTSEESSSQSSTPKKAWKMGLDEESEESESEESSSEEKDTDEDEYVVVESEIREFELSEDNTTPTFEMKDYLDQTVRVEITLSKGCGSGGFDVSFADYSGLIKLEENGSSWTKKEFSFYYDSIEEPLAYAFYQPEEFGTNSIKVYANGQFVTEEEILPLYNEFTIDFSKYTSGSVLVDFVVDQTREGSNGEKEIGVYYVSTLPWMQKMSYEADVTGYFMTLQPLDKAIGNYDQHGVLTINGTDKREFVLNEENPTPCFGMGGYLGETVDIEIELSNGCGGGFDLSFVNYSGLIKLQEDGSSWTSQEFSFYYTSTEDSKTYSFYQPESFGTNGVSLYINGEYISHYTILPEFNEIVVNLEKYSGKSVIITFEADKTTYSENDETYIGVYCTNALQNIEQGGNE